VTPQPAGIRHSITGRRDPDSGPPAAARKVREVEEKRWPDIQVLRERKEPCPSRRPGSPVSPS